MMTSRIRLLLSRTTIALGVLTKRILQNFLVNKRVVLLVSCFSEGTEGRRGNRGPEWGQRAVEEIEGRREDRGPQRGHGVIEGQRAADETEGSTVERIEGRREDRGL
jgi:hypothetical protein